MCCGCVCVVGVLIVGVFIVCVAGDAGAALVLRWLLERVGTNTADLGDRVGAAAVVNVGAVGVNAGGETGVGSGRLLLVGVNGGASIENVNCFALSARVSIKLPMWCCAGTKSASMLSTAEMSRLSSLPLLLKTVSYGLLAGVLMQC